MSHLDEGTLLALRDGSPVQETAWSHVKACPQCTEALDALRAVEVQVSQALAALDDPLDVESARERVRARVTRESAEAAGRKPLALPFRAMPSLRWAAGLVLVTAAAAYAVPGSPMRAWVDAILAPSSTATEATSPGDTPSGPESAGVRVTVAAPVQVSILGLAPGEELTVSWVPGSEVAVFAESQSRFTSGSSRVQATVSGGPVRVELPVDIRPLTLEVGGRIWLRSLDDGVELAVEPVEAEGGFIRFVAPGPGGS